MRLNNDRSAGFTLVEVLVILAIMAALAGVLVPALSGQIRKGQVNRTVADLNGIRAAAIAFFSEVSRYPGDLHDLANQISLTDRDIANTLYTPRQLTLWSGPYLDKSVADGGTLGTGFGGVILDDLTVNQHTNGVNYLTIRVMGLSSQEFQTIDAVLDEGNGASLGRVRFTTLGDTLKFYAVPIQ